VVVDLELARVLTESLLDDLLLDGLVDVVGVEAVEALVVVEEVQVEVDLGLASGAGLNLELIVDLLEFGAGDGGLILVGGEADSGLTEKTIDELLGVLGINGELVELSVPGTSIDVQGVVVVRGEEGLVAREVGGLPDVTKTVLLSVTSLEVVQSDVGGPEERLHQGKGSFSAESNLTVDGILVGDLAGDGGVDEVGNLIVGLVPSAQSNAVPESLGRVGDEEQGQSSEADLGLLSLVEVDGHKQRADDFLLLNGQMSQSEDGLGANNVAKSVILVLLVDLGSVHIVFLDVLLVQGLAGLNPLLPHLLLGQVDQIALVALVPLILVGGAGLAAGDVGLQVRNDDFVADVSKGGEVSDTLRSITGGLDLLVEEGNQLVGNDGVAGGAELTHDQLGEHVQAEGGVNASLVDQAGQGKSSGDLNLAMALNVFGPQEILIRIILKIDSIIKNY